MKTRHLAAFALVLCCLAVYVMPVVADGIAPGIKLTDDEYELKFDGLSSWIPFNVVTGGNVMFYPATPGGKVYEHDEVGEWDDVYINTRPATGGYANGSWMTIYIFHADGTFDMVSEKWDENGSPVPGTWTHKKGTYRKKA